jgi:hypothetical protein
VKRDLERKIHELEAFTKTIKAEIVRILQGEHKIIFMVTAIKYSKELMK